MIEAKQQASEGTEWQDAITGHEYSVFEAGPTIPQNAIAWEYAVARSTGPLNSHELNRYGSWGWELVSHVCDTISQGPKRKAHVYTFKRKAKGEE